MPYVTTSPQHLELQKGKIPNQIYFSIHHCSGKFSPQDSNTETGEMAQWLRALAAFPEDPGTIPSTHMGVTVGVTPVSGDLTPSSDLCGHYMHMVHKHTCE